MGSARLIIGDVFEVMATIPDGSVDLIMTSPPFLALRSYLPSDHPQKHLEIGSEPTPAAFIDTLLALSAEWRRVLAPHGSIAVELGDTYAGSGGAGGDYAEGGMREGQPAFDGSGRKHVRRPGRTEWEAAHPIAQPQPKTVPTKGYGWPLSKSLCMIPALYSASLAYGRNLLTGEPSPAGQWRVRNIVRWCRPNPPVGALGDKFRPATSEMTIACVSGTRYFDLDAVREPHKGDHKDGEAIGNNKGGENGYSGFGRDVKVRVHHPAGAPPLDWWEIPTQPYKSAHYATWPEALLTRPIKAMCPTRVCTTCGEPSRRLTEATYTHDSSHANGTFDGDATYVAAEQGQYGGPPSMRLGRARKVVDTLGWSDCGCRCGHCLGCDGDWLDPKPECRGKWRNGLVLDAFAGSGTTLAVAVGHGRDALGIDLDERNADLAVERLGMFLTVEHHVKEGAA